MYSMKYVGRANESAVDSEGYISIQLLSGT
jgi:hypothetical protein